jgi:hypothetical protein
MEGITAGMGDKRILRNDDTTWKNYGRLAPVHSMNYHHFGLGNSQFAWDVRSHPGVSRAFSELWGTPPEDLITSVEGIAVHFPPEITGRGFYRGRQWFHTEQRSTRPGLESVRGLVNVYDVDPGDATLRVLCGSHRLHGAYFDHYGVECDKDWYRLPDQDAHVRFFEDRGCRKASVVSRAGDLVLWDSRIMHCGVEPRKWRGRPKMMGAVYVCQTPRSKADPDILRWRERRFEERRTLSHLPHEPTSFGMLPRSWKGVKKHPIEALPPPALSALARSIM